MSDTDTPDPLLEFLAYSKRIGIPEGRMLTLLGAKPERVTELVASGSLVIPKHTLDYIKNVLDIWAEALRLSKSPEDLAKIEKIRKLLRLGGDANPNAHERNAARRMAEALMRKHGFTALDI